MVYERGEARSTLAPRAFFRWELRAPVLTPRKTQVPNLGALLSTSYLTLVELRQSLSFGVTHP